MRQTPTLDAVVAERPKLPPSPRLPWPLGAFAFVASRRRTVEWLTRTYGRCVTIRIPVFGDAVLVSGTLVAPQQALDIDLVDALEDSFEETVRHAVRWCTELLELPRHSMLANREIARTQFKEAFSTIAADAVKKLTDAWFSDATQTVLHDFVAKLKKKA